MQKWKVFYLYDTLLLTTEFRSRLYYITTLLSNNYYNEKQKQKTYANPDPIDRHAMRGLYFEFATLPKKYQKKNATEIMLLSKCVPDIYGVALKRFHGKIVFDVHFILCWVAVIICIVVVTTIDTAPTLPPPPSQIECTQTIKCKLTAHICFELHNIFVTSQNFHIRRPFARPFSLSHILIR